MRILLALILAITALSQSPAMSDTPPATLVIIDTGFDTSIPVIGNATIFEACILDWSMCPNGSSMQEGPGAATVSSNSNTFNGIGHGTQMASIAIDINPQQKLILIRLIAYNSRGQRMTVFDSSVARVFKWIVKKREELNIGAVAMAQGHHGLLSGKDYCPRNTELEKAITELRMANVPVFFPAGNAGDKSRIDWPACIPSSIALGAINPEGKIADYSNYDKNLVDFYTTGSASTLLPGGSRVNTSGTSVSTIVAAAQWLQFTSTYPGLRLSQVSQAFRDFGPIIFDSKYRYGRKIDLPNALAKWALAGN